MTDRAAADPIRVVVADDHRMFVEAITHLFQSVPDIDLIGAASDGDALLAMARAAAPDIAVLDISMPGPGLINLVNALGEIAPDCRVVVLTMHLEPHFAAQALQLGVAGYVVKDAAFQEMVTALRTAADGGTYLSRQIAERLKEDRPPAPAMTPREIECLQAAAEGMTNKMIAKRLRLTERTVRFHFENICRKLQVSRRGEAVAVARDLRLI